MHGTLFRIMKNKNTTIGIIIVVIVIIILYVVFHGGSGTSYAPSTSNTSNNSSASTGSGIPAPTGPNATAPNSPSAPVTAVATVSSTLSSYENDELGFNIKYPTAWTLTKNPTGPMFSIPASTSKTGTINASIGTAPSTCQFPTVATSSIVSNKTVAVGTLSFKMLSIAATVKGVSYADQMYTLQQGTAAAPLCYVFTFSSTASSKTDVTAATTAFTAMVKSFAFVVGPAGQSETAHPNGN